MTARKPHTPIPAATRKKIITAIKAGDLSCRAIAREYGVSPATVSKIAATLPGDSFNRANTQKAAVARAFDAKAARAALVQDLYVDAQRFRQRAWEPYTQIITTQVGPEFVTTKLPPIREQQAAMTATAICIDKALVLERHDDEAGSAAGKTMVNDLMGALGMVYHRIVTEDQHGINPDTGEALSAADEDASKVAQVVAAEQATR